MEAMWCLKRRLSDIVYQQMITDALTHTSQRRRRVRGQPGNDSDSSVTDSHSRRRLFGSATP